MDTDEMEYFNEAEQDVERVRAAALKPVQLTHPEIKTVVDRRSITLFHLIVDI